MACRNRLAQVVAGILVARRTKTYGSIKVLSVIVARCPDELRYTYAHLIRVPVLSHQKHRSGSSLGRSWQQSIVADVAPPMGTARNPGITVPIRALRSRICIDASDACMYTTMTDRFKIKRLAPHIDLVHWDASRFAPSRPVRPVPSRPVHAYPAQSSRPTAPRSLVSASVLAIPHPMPVLTSQHTNTGHTDAGQGPWSLEIRGLSQTPHSSGSAQPQGPPCPLG